MNFEFIQQNMGWNNKISLSFSCLQGAKLLTKFHSLTTFCFWTNAILPHAPVSNVCRFSERNCGYCSTCWLFSSSNTCSNCLDSLKAEVTVYHPSSKHHNVIDVIILSWGKHNLRSTSCSWRGFTQMRDLVGNYSWQVKSLYSRTKNLPCCFHFLYELSQTGQEAPSHTEPPPALSCHRMQRTRARWVPPAYCPIVADTVETLFPCEWRVWHLGLELSGRPLCEIAWCLSANHSIPDAQFSAAWPQVFFNFFEM